MYGGAAKKSCNSNNRKKKKFIVLPVFFFYCNTPICMYVVQCMTIYEDKDKQILLIFFHCDMTAPSTQK